MVDQQARNKLAQQLQASILPQAIGNAVAQALPPVPEDTESKDLMNVLAIVLSSLDQQIDALREELTVFEPLKQEFSRLKQKVEEGNSIVIPDQTTVSGKVDIGMIEQPLEVTVKNQPVINIPEIPPFPKPLPFPEEMNIKTVRTMPPVEVKNFSDLATPLAKELAQTTQVVANTGAMTIKAINSLKLTVPSKFTVDNEIKIDGWNDYLQRIEDLKQGIQLVVNKIGELQLGGPTSKVEVTNFPIPKIPQPVTNISVNALGGVVLATPTSVLTTATPLPGTPNLADRRTLIVYNNSAQTVYIGGSGVTVAGGLPLPAGTYSPPMDAGVNMTVYGIVASGNADVRVMEISDTAIGR